MEYGSRLTAPDIVRPFSLDDPRRGWLIVAGSIDIFLLDRDTGHRAPITRLSQGRTFRGLASDCSAYLVASPLPGAVLEFLDEKETSRGVASEWLEELVRAATEDLSPPSRSTISARQDIVADDESRSLQPESTFILLRQLAGTSLVLGQSDCVLDEGDWCVFPFTAWLEVQPGGRVRSYGDLSTNISTHVDSGFRKLEQSVLKALSRKMAAEQQERSERIRERARQDRAMLSDSLLQVGSITDTNVSSQPSRDASGDALLAALSQLAATLNVQLQVPPGLHSTRTVEDRLRSVCAASGLRIRPVLLRGDWWRRSNHCLLGFLEPDGIPVSLIPRIGGFDLYDPESRSRRRLRKKRAQALSASAFILYRSFPRTELNCRSLLRFSMYGSRGDAIAVLVFGLLGGLLSLITPIVTGVIYDSIIPGAERPDLMVAALLVLCAAISVSLLSWARGLALMRVESRMSAEVQCAVWDRLLSLPTSFFRNFSSGDLALRSLGIDQIRQLLTASLTSSIVSGVFSLFGFALLFFLDWRLALLATGLVTLLLGFNLSVAYRSVKIQQELAKLNGDLSSFVLQILSGIAKLRVANAEKRAFSIWSRYFALQQHKSVAARNINLLISIFQATFPLLTFILIFWAVGRLGSDQSVPFSTGRFVAFTTALGQFLGAALSFCYAVQNALSAVPAFQRAHPILQSAPENGTLKTQPGVLSGKIEFKQLVFAYRKGGESPVLNGISLCIQPGEFVAIVGASGSGKSTLCRLLLGFEKPQAGAIYLDGQDLAGLDVQAVRKQMGSILQTSRLRADNLYRNIVGDLPLSVDDAIEAARLAGLEKDIHSMPMGIFTLIGENGIGLSGGQRQRVLIARALVTRPKILILDEATSALDNQTQWLVTRNLIENRATRVVVAHRLSTISRADQIYFLHRGRIAEHGTYSELLVRNGFFAEFAKRQLL